MQGNDIAATAAPTFADRLYEAPALASRHIALLAAWLATGGSLFMSEVWHWIPCLMCWYQRILMYPLALILLVGILRRDRGLHWYVLPFSLIGMLVSLYHYLLIMTDWFPPPPCSTGVPCTVDYINFVGPLSFIKVPFLALTAFTIITIFMVARALFQAEEDAAVAAGAIPPPRVPTGLGSSGIAALVIAVGAAAFFVISGLVT